MGSSGSGSVFADPTGRRRRLVTVAGAAVGLGLVSALALLVAGLLGASPVPLPGLPQGGQGAQEAVVPAEVPPSEPAPTVTARPTGAPAGGPAGAPAGTRTAGSPTTPAPSSASSGRSPRGNRPTDHPGNPNPGKSK